MNEKPEIDGPGPIAPEDAKAMVAIDKDEQAAAGRRSRSPLEIPAGGWGRIHIRALAAMGANNLSVAAAGVAFFGFFSIFPALAFLASTYGLIFEVDEAARHLYRLRGLFPYEVRSVLDETLLKLSARETTNVGLGWVISAAVAFWSTTAAVRAMMSALNIAYREQEKRNFFIFAWQAIVFCGVSVVFVILSFGLIGIAPGISEAMGLRDSVDKILEYGRWPVLVIVTMVALALLYTFGPSRTRPRLIWVSWGAITATILWVALTAAYSYYVSNFANFDNVFGSFGTLAGLLLWFFLSAYSILFGAVINAESELQTVRDTTKGPPKPLGERGAYVADNVVD